eukprot:TRINITY_DN10641_c0_g1_i3.p1 TRINITY_DN10641_c0_g1~~TRINITY_DN10641_c0_g1_i3.p1  ORF type:complete len:134 (-),score=27.06 TRINITY_DN10641_c0_g1_i3:59-403(-)
MCIRDRVSTQSTWGKCRYCTGGSLIFDTLSLRGIALYCNQCTFKQKVLEWQCHAKLTTETCNKCQSRIPEITLNKPHDDLSDTEYKVCVLCHPQFKRLAEKMRQGDGKGAKGRR